MAGKLALEVEGEDHLLRANEGLEVAPRQAHQASNWGEPEVRFLVTSQPPSHGDRIDV